MRFQDLDDEDDLDDSEYPDAPDDDDDETISCPYCFRPVYEGAEQCPSCRRYLSREDAPTRHPWWIVVGVLLCLIVVLGWIVR
jgi:hypothetical protein